MIATRGKALGRRTGFGVGDDGDAQFTLSTAHEHAVCYGICSDKSNSMLSGNPHSGIYEADTSRTLDNNCGNPACNQGGIAVVEQETASGVICLNPHDSQSARVYDANGVWHSLNANSGGGQSRDAVCYSSAGFNGGQSTGGLGYETEMSPTIRSESSAIDPTVAYPEVSRTLSARHDSSPCIDRGQEMICYPETFQTLTANNAGGQQRMPDKANLSVICIKDEPR